MTEAQTEAKLKNVYNKILYPVLAAVVIMLVTNISGYFLTVRSNSKSITSLESSKVDQDKFNRFIKMYAEFSVLTEERHIIINQRLDLLEERQRVIELEKLSIIEKNIAIIQEHMKTLLKQYGLYTRGAEEVEFNPLLFITEI